MPLVECEQPRPAGAREEPEVLIPVSRPRLRPGLEGGSLIAAVALLIMCAWAPTPYVVERPGPTFDIAGEVGEHTPEGEERIIVVNLSGRGDKDVDYVAEKLGITGDADEVVR